jgi:F-type H+-transporting ATPase subunit delta
VKISKQARHSARQLLQTCLIQGALDESRVRQVVAALANGKPRDYLGILTHFKRLVRLEAERHMARIESAAPLSMAQQSQVQTSLVKRYGPGLRFEFTQNQALLGGLRVKIGSDVYDGSVRARLAALEERLTS